jgi:capsular polysaccharide biosynthesis protein
MLQLFAVSVMVFPSDMVIKVIGGGGYVAALLAYFMFLAYIAVTLFGLHNPLDYRSPVRIALCALWLAALTSYALMNRTLLSSSQLSSADRWLIQLAGISGVILVAAEFLRSIEDIHRVLRALIWAGAFCGIVAALQFWLNQDITPYLKMILPGFRLNQVGAGAIGSRSGLNRVAGTATGPIELGVVAGMLLPLAAYMAMYDVGRSKVRRWFPLICIALGVPISVSRAAILSAILGLAVLVICLPPARRLTAIAAIPVAVAGIFLTAHRLLGTLLEYFGLGKSDNSISHRVDNYPYVAQLVARAPWFGQGGGTYIAGNFLNLGQGHILDNQYLDSLIEIGFVGLMALAFYLFWPFAAALAARSRSSDSQLRDLCAALAGCELAGLVCSATFDSLAYPMFLDVQALVAGFIGAAWLLVERENVMARAALSFNHDNGTAKIIYLSTRKLPSSGRKLMDLVSIIQSLWRHKLVSIPVIVFTAMAALYVVKIKPPVYDSAASILLANPPVGASQSQIAINPKLKGINPYNTFAAYGNLTYVADTVIELVTSPEAQPGLIQSGVDPRYQMTMSTADSLPPIIDITGVGSSPQEAIRSASVLVKAAKSNLVEMQKKQGINPFYMVTTVDLVKPTVAERSTSGKLRSLVAVLGLGAVLLFVAVSVTDTLNKRKRNPAGGGNTTRFDTDARATARESARLGYGTADREGIRSGSLRSSRGVAVPPNVSADGSGSIRARSRQLRLRNKTDETGS